MKKMWNGEFLQGMEELAETEERAIVGGGILSYWVGYAVGWVSGLFSTTTPVQPTSQKLVKG